MIIALDLDDVVLDFYGTWQRLYRTWFDQEPDEWTSWEGAVGSPVFDNKAESLAWFERIGGYSQMNWSPAFVPGAPAAIETLMRRYTVHFVSARATFSAVNAATDWWCSSPWRDRTFLTCTPHKETVRAGVYVDDSPVVAGRLLHLGHKVVLMDRPWNQVFGVENTENMLGEAAAWTRADTWAQALEQIDIFVKGDIR